MYRVLRAGILYFDDNMKDCRGRYELVRPLKLLVHTSDFNDAREKKTEDYFNLCDIISRMRELYLTGEARYHHFEMLLNELQVLGFDISDVDFSKTTNDGKLKDQIDLILQFLAFRYPADAYDNKVGTHDVKTKQFIFIQP